MGKSERAGGRPRGRVIEIRARTVAAGTAADDFRTAATADLLGGDIDRAATRGRTSGTRHGSASCAARRSRRVKDSARTAVRDGRDGDELVAGVAAGGGGSRLSTSSAIRPALAAPTGSSIGVGGRTYATTINGGRVRTRVAACARGAPRLYVVRLYRRWRCCRQLMRRRSWCG